MTDTTAKFKAQLPRNVFLQVLAFIARIAVGVALTPYLVKHLGRAAYGLVPIAGIMTEYVSIITQGISGATGRFLAIALQRDDVDDANRVMNTAFFSYLGLALIQIPIFGLILYYANLLFAIPQVLYRDAILLLGCSAVSFLVNLVCSVFVVPMYANNRLDILRAFDIGRQIGRISAIVVLFMAFRPTLRYVGYVDLAVSLCVAAGTVVVGRRLAPTLKLNVRAYDWRKLRELLGMGGWLVVNYLGFLLFLRIDVWVCNRFVGADAAGEYAAVLQWSTLIRHGGTVLATMVAPMLVIYYARSETENLIRLTKLSVRILCLLLAIPVSILCAFSSSILALWLGESFAPLASLMVIMLCHLTINVGMLPLFNIQTTLNKVRIPALVTVALGIVNAALALGLVEVLGWGVYGVAIAGAIILTAKNAFFTPVYAAVILNRPWYTFAKGSLSGVAFLAGLTGVGYGLNCVFLPTSWGHLIALSFLVGVTGLVGVWFMLSRKDRRLMIDLVPRRFQTLARRLMLA